MNSSISNSKGLLRLYGIAALTGLATLVGASEWLVRSAVLPTDTFVRHVAIFNGTTSPYAAFGDSHVARNFNAAAPVVNLAYPSENLAKMDWKTALYVDQAPAPQKVLLQADPHIFSHYRLVEGLEDYPSAFQGGEQYQLLSLNARYRPQLFALWRSFLSNGGKLVSKIEQTPQGALLSPGDLSSWPQEAAEKFSRDRVQLHLPVHGFETSAAARTYRDIVERFTRRGAEVCLVMFPTAPVYRRHVETLDADARARWDKAIGFFRALANAPGVEYFDHSSLYADPSLFRDPDHLNKSGALVYGPVVQQACFGDVDEGNEFQPVITAGQ